MSTNAVNLVESRTCRAAQELSLFPQKGFKRIVDFIYFIQRLTAMNYWITVCRIFIWLGISSDIRSEI